MSELMEVTPAETVNHPVGSSESQKPNSWNKPLNHEPKPAKLSQEGDLILFELHVKITDKSKKVPSLKLMEYLDGKSAKSLNTLSSKSATVHHAFFTDEDARDAFHGKNAVINGVNVSFESYPPKQSEHFVAPPKIISTKMRLIALPPHLSLTKIQKAILDKIPSYIVDSASFETFSTNRMVRNGNLSFFVRGIKHGLPFGYLRVDDYDVILQNSTHPLDPSFTLKISSEDKDPEPIQKDRKEKNVVRQDGPSNTSVASTATTFADAPASFINTADAPASSTNTAAKSGGFSSHLINMEEENITENNKKNWNNPRLQ